MWTSLSQLIHRGPGRTPGAPHRFVLRLDALEGRLAPATLVSPTAVAYTDVDGDRVTVTTSKGSFADPQTSNDNFTFTPAGLGEQLQVINLAGGAGEFAGASLTVLARRTAAGGDGHVNVGYLNAGGIDLSRVTVDGNLERFDAGDADPLTTGLAGLTVRSLGRFGTPGEVLELGSTVHGRLGALVVRSDVVEARVLVTGGEQGTIGSVTVGGSVRRDPVAGGALITTQGALGPVRIGGFLSGRIHSDGSLAGVIIGGSLVGDEGYESGTVYSRGAMRPVRIGGDLRGGPADFSGYIRADGPLAGVTVGGSAVGGAGVYTGTVSARAGAGPVRVAGDLRGGAGSASGAIVVNGRAAGVTVRGSVVGGIGQDSGVVTATGMGPVRVGDSVRGGSGPRSGLIYSPGDVGPVRVGGDLRGGPTDSSGSILAEGALAGVTVGGSALGGGGYQTGAVFSRGDLGPVRIAGDLRGAAGRSSGTVTSSARAAGVTVGGSVLGGASDNTGMVTASEAGAIRIGGDLQAGGPYSGQISVNGALAALTVGGSVRGGGDSSGTVYCGGELGLVRIAGDLVGGSVTGATPVSRSGYIEGRRIASVFIGGSVIAGRADGTGALTDCGSIRAGDDLGPVTVRGSLVGNDTHPVIIAARGQAVPAATGDVAIARLTVGGRVEYADIFAGLMDSSGVGNADASIGPVTVGGDWIASNLVAGATAGGDQLFGTADDVRLSGTQVKDEPGVVARIARITIRGQALGTDGGADHYGFVAEQVGALAFGGTVVPLTDGPDDVAVGATSDLQLREVRAETGQEE